MRTAYLNGPNGNGLFEVQVLLDEIEGFGSTFNPTIKMPVCLTGVNNPFCKKVMHVSMYGYLMYQNSLLSNSLVAMVDIELTGQQKDRKVDLFFPADSKAVEFIEANRKANIDFTLNIGIQYLYIRNDDNSLSSHVTYGQTSMVIPHSEWVNKVLNRIGFDKKFLLELEYPLINDVDFIKNSVLAMDQARIHFDNGLYDDAVSKCRLAIEPFFEIKEIDGKRIKLFKEKWKNQLAESTYEWLSNVCKKVTDATNKSHHSVKQHYNRSEAHLVLILTISIVSFVSFELEDLQSSSDEKG